MLKNKKELNYLIDAIESDIPNYDGKISIGYWKGVTGKTEFIAVVAYDFKTIKKYCIRKNGLMPPS